MSSMKRAMQGGDIETRPDVIDGAGADEGVRPYTSVFGGGL